MRAINNSDQYKVRKKINLIYLPYAGGSNNYFEPITKAIQKLIQKHEYEIRIFEVTLPGRGARYGEPLCKNIDDLVIDVLKQTQHLMYQPYAFFGHSMGSLLAYALVHQVRKSGLPLPIQLFLSGRGAPSKSSHSENYLLSVSGLKAKLQNYGGINTEILNNDTVFSFFEPIIRADFEAVETWKYRYRPKLNISTTIFSGTEEDITNEELKAWQKEFENKIQFKIFEGGHFFINHHATSIATTMIGQLQPTPQPQPQRAY